MAMSRRYNHTMSPSFAPLKLLLMMFVGWVNRHQLDVIEYLQEENRVLKERLGGRHIIHVIRLPPRSPNLTASAARIRHCPTPSSCSTPTAPRRNAQLLPSGRSLTNVDCFFGQFGHGAE